MANTDYIQTGVGRFAPFIKLNEPIGIESTVFVYAEFNIQSPSDVSIGMAGMIDDEIVRVVGVGDLSIAVKRGCADTIPAPHSAGALCWLFSSATGTDQKEYSAGEAIGIKAAPFTMGGGALPVEKSNPDSLTFNWRFFRPYPPAQMRANGARWYEPAAVSADIPALTLTWVDRDRVLQADQLLGHDDPTIGPEPGTIYTMRAYDDAGTLLREEFGISGNSFMYQRAKIAFDLRYPESPTSAHVSFTSSRDGFDAWQFYTINFTLDPAGALTSEYMAFGQHAFESPYFENMRRGVGPESSRAIGVAARPIDRMSDQHFMLVNDVQTANGAGYTPWVTTNFRLPELETTLNIRSLSLWDGVPLRPEYVGQYALIDDEIVRIAAIGATTVTIDRGAADTVPQVHQAGAVMWLFQADAAFDNVERVDGQVIDYKMQPMMHGPQIDPSTLPINTVGFDGRAARPYPPGRVVVNGRPWFEEVQATSGGNVVFTWARRNRTLELAHPSWHTLGDEVPEQGQQVLIQVYYDTPSATPGQRADSHILRTITSSGLQYVYPYSLALTDGQAAGTALGVCGTVVIYVRIAAIRDGIESAQGYHVPMRVPSYSCAA